MRKIKAANTVSLTRYGAGIIKWNMEELQEIDRKSRKIMKMNKELHPRNDVARIYVPRKKIGRGLISCEGSVRREEKNLSWYVRNSKEALLKKSWRQQCSKNLRSCGSKGVQSERSKGDGKMHGNRKECMHHMREKRKILTGIKLGSGLQEEI